MDLSTAFGLLSLGVVVLALASGWHVYQKLALTLLVAWASTNVAVELMNFDRAPLVIPSMDAVFSIIVAIIGYANKSRIALVVFIAYALVGVVHVGAFILHQQAGFYYYATLDIMFLAQLLNLGAASGGMAVRRGIAWGRQRPRSHSPRW